MVDVVRSTFEKLYPEITHHIDKAAFVAIDTEFTGIATQAEHKNSLFDNGEDRYQLLKQLTNNFIVCQIGLSAFVPVNNNCYEAFTYNFYVCPSSHGIVEEWFSCQVSSLEFLCEHNFDFNKLVYEGVFYANLDKEAKLQALVQNQSFLAAAERLVDDRTMQELCSEVAVWLVKAEEGQTLRLKACHRFAPYLLHVELQQRFPCVWTSDTENGQILVEKVSPEVRKQRETSSDTHGQRFLNSALGFTRVFRHLVKAKKPIVGHNLLTDLLLVYSQFHKALPKNLAVFKKEIVRFFPTIYDTKHIAFQLKKQRKGITENLLDAPSLEELYRRFSSDKGMYAALYSPAINHGEGHDRYVDKGCPHEAGFDAYMAGYLFLRLAHLSASWELSGTTLMMRPLSSKEHLAALHHLRNRVNVIRAQIHYINLSGEDPPANRPHLLVVESQSKKPLNYSEVTELMSQFGTVDLRPVSLYRAVIAAGNIRCAKDILRGFRQNTAYKVTCYSMLHHSPVVRCILWTGVLLCGLGFAGVFTLAICKRKTI